MRVCKSVYLRLCTCVYAHVIPRMHYLHVEAAREVEAHQAVGAVVVRVLDLVLIEVLVRGRQSLAHNVANLHQGTAH